jgi:hypothetical protein
MHILLAVCPAPFPTTLASRADAWRLQGAGCERVGALCGLEFDQPGLQRVSLASWLTLDAKILTVAASRLGTGERP